MHKEIYKNKEDGNVLGSGLSFSPEKARNLIFFLFCAFLM